MKRFSSYGPPSPHSEFMVQRPGLVRHISGQLVGNPEDKGHYFTVFAPRQRGKSTTLRSVVEHIRALPGQPFHVGMAILHLVKDLSQAFNWILPESLELDAPTFKDWADVRAFFSKSGPLTKPVILILDEFDALPDEALQDAISFFRGCYHHRSTNWLHGVALIGVHSSLGKLEGRTSPFNVQRAVNVPNLTRDEVTELYAMYQAESGQAIEPTGVDAIYDLFRGQPGLTCWFGELLTEKYNPVQPPPWERTEPPPEGYPTLTRSTIQVVGGKAQRNEININIRNLISKGLQHKLLLRELFVSHEVEFDLNNADLQWLYLNGIVVGEPDPTDPSRTVCAFASPFVQRCLFTAFGKELRQAYSQSLFFRTDQDAGLMEATQAIDVPSLLAHYRRFLVRQADKGDPPWNDQPARTDARAFEAIGHFNLYAWLYGVAKRGYSIIPEFPTGNGTADLWLVNQRTGRQEVLEVKSFGGQVEFADALEQVTRYARKLNLTRAYLVMMADQSAYVWLSKQATLYTAGDITLNLEVIPWGFVPDAVLPAHVPAAPGSSAPAPTSVPKKPRRSPRPAATPKARLSPEDRLALEVLVMPHLTPETLELVWNRVALAGDPPQQVRIDVGWTRLVKQLTMEERVGELAAVLRFTFPALAAHPLLETLGTLGA